jgi:hypothetical protein
MMENLTSPADVKKWRRTILPRIAAAVARQKQLYKSGDWQPRYLALLAQAASANGNQAQALQLTNLAPAELERSDDLLLVRAIALQRAARPRMRLQLIESYWPSFQTRRSPGARLRLAFALQDNHEAGGALVELARLLPRQANGESTAQEDANFGFANSPYTGALVVFRKAKPIGVLGKARSIPTSPAPISSKCSRQSIRSLISRP